MKTKLKEAFEHELSLGQKAIRVQDYALGMRHLERAHILGQRHIVPHTQTHWWMLQIGLKTGNPKEIVGQIFRLVTGILGSTLGILPIGNTGGANVSAFKKMPIPDDLKKILSDESFG